MLELGAAGAEEKAWTVDQAHEFFVGVVLASVVGDLYSVDFESFCPALGQQPFQGGGDRVRGRVGEEQATPGGVLGKECDARAVGRSLVGFELPRKNRGDTRFAATQQAFARQVLLLCAQFPPRGLDVAWLDAS